MLPGRLLSRGTKGRDRRDCAAGTPRIIAEMVAGCNQDGPKVARTRFT